MAIAFVAADSDASGTMPGPSLDLVVDMPSGYAAGHALLVGIETTNASASSGTITPPTGWTLIGAVTVAGSGSTKLRVYYKYATGSEGSTQTFVVPIATGQDYPWVSLAYSGTAPNYYTEAGNYSTSGSGSVASWTSPTYNTNVAEVPVSIWLGFDVISKDGGSTLRSPSLSTNPIALDRAAGPGTTSGTTLTRTLPLGSFAAITVGLRPVNSAPYAPTLVSPTGGGSVDVAASNVFYFSFADPDSDLPRPEGQNKYEIRYRVVGAPSWTTLTPAATTNQFHTFAAATFTAGSDYEWQVRTYDLAVVVGDWSASGFFTGRNAPASPTITDPTLDEEITAHTADLDWTSTPQTSYQVRKVADTAGSPDTTVVYYDSGTIADAVVRTASLSFPVNNRTEHLQVRVWDGFLWSAWSSVRVDVAFIPPPDPTFTISTDADTASLVIDITNPTPVGDEPDPVLNNVYIDDGGDIGVELKADLADLALDATASFMTPRSGRDYENNIWVVSVTADGIESESGPPE